MAAPAAYKLEDRGGGRFALAGVVGFTTATALLKNGETLFKSHPSVEVDLAGVTQSDSAGLALLIEWLSSARRAGRPMKFSNVPAQLKALAHISEVEDFLLVPEQAPAPRR